MQEEIKKIREEIEHIKLRNVRVELDKAWEVSNVRKILITCITYIVVTSFFLIANLPNPFINALVPSLAFLLSTASISVAKQWWIRRIQK